jgi:hypothetical protein
MAAGYKWHPITDLDDDPRSLTDGELDSLWRVWQSQKKDLAEREVLAEFEQRLRREWAIETGTIEDVYTLDRGVTRTLIEKGIDAALIPHGATNRDTVLVARVIQDHYDALEGMFDFIGGQRSLSTGYIKELHAALLRNQETRAVVDQFGKVFEKPLEKGKYKIARQFQRGQCMSTVRLNTLVRRWMSSSECTLNIRHGKYRRKWMPPGCTIASRKSIPLPMEMAA